MKTGLSFSTNVVENLEDEPPREGRERVGGSFVKAAALLAAARFSAKAFKAVFGDDVFPVGFFEHQVEFAAEVVDGFFEWAIVQVTVPRFEGHFFGDIPSVDVVTVRTSERIDVAANFVQ